MPCESDVKRFSPVDGNAADVVPLSAPSCRVPLADFSRGPQQRLGELRIDSRSADLLGDLWIRATASGNREERNTEGWYCEPDHCAHVRHLFASPDTPLAQSTPAAAAR